MQALRTWSRWLSTSICLASTIAWAQEAPQPIKNSPPVSGRIEPAPLRATLVGQGDGKTFNVLVENPAAPADEGTVFVASLSNLAAAEAGKYWIGLLCVDAGEALRQQLGLEAGVGLLVESVTDEAPAKNAGIEKNDVLLSVRLPSDDPKTEPKPLRNINDLVEAVQQAGTKPLKLTLLRRGQRQTIEVTPTERPQTPARFPGYHFGPVEQGFRLLLDAQRKHAELAANPNQAGSISELRFAGPMFVQPSPPPKLPDGMSMEFRQVVGQPERVLVSQGDQKWDVSVEELAKLPADVRAHVEQQLAFRRGTYFAPGIGPAPHSVAVPMAWYYNFLAAAPSLPNNLTVTIVRKGSEPARITVKKDDQSWEITEKELDKLPADVRKHVEPMLTGRYPMAKGAGISAWARSAAKTTPRLEFDVRKGHEIIPAEPPTHPQPAPPAASPNPLQERQDAMLKQLKELTEKVEKLQQALEKSTPKP